MKSIFASVIALSLAASTAFAQLTINTPPTAVQCEPLLITWTGGTPPYFLVIIPGNQGPSVAPIVSFNQTSATQVTWFVDVTPQSIDLVITDSTGLRAQSAPFPINAGTAGNTNCTLTTTSASFGATAANAPTAANPSGSSSPTNSVTNSVPASAASGSSGSSTGSSAASAASSTSTKSGASRVTGQVAVAGIIGAAMVALLG